MEETVRNLFRFGGAVFGAALASSLLLTSCGSGAGKPVQLSIIDVAGNLQLSKPAIEAFKAANPKLVSDIEYVSLSAPELVSKIKAQQMASNLDTTMVLTGYDGMAAGVEEQVWEQLMPKYQKDFQATIDNYLPGAKAAYDLFDGYGLTYVYCPGGPMFTYNPDKVKNPPKTAADLLAWAKANPGKFIYARPANSGPGRAFLMGLPYLLGDSNPKDPTTWDKTWAYLKELGNYIDYYPSGTGITFKELAEGTRWMIASHIGWDINQRILGTIPNTFQGLILDNTTWVTDSQFMVIPKGLDKAREHATVELMKWLMLPQEQAVTFDDGYFYPGPAIKGVTLDMAPQASQDRIRPALRPAYDQAIASLPATTQLDAKALVTAFDMWDKLIGSKAKQ